MTDQYAEQLTGVWVDGPPPKLAGQVQVVDYDPDWPRLYRREEDRIRTILGDRVLRIEHIGSTSVPDLPAKPIIDIALVVADSADEPAYVPALAAAGYKLVIREPDWFEHRCLKGPDTNINLHVFSLGAAEIDRCTRFRDWLRSHPADRDLYARTKRDLAARQWTYIQQYADAKTEVVQEILARAASSPSAGRVGPTHDGR
jgi:GrpB-like predicted nucleotidyltransferase (UPF0157 family)